jgi:hypothetical protein
MKWGGYSEKAAERISKLFGGRGIYILLILAAFVMMSGASDKWAP